MKTFKNTLQFLLTLSCLALLFNSCKKKDHEKMELPPVTMEGKNTFGFMIDNKIWLPDTRRYAFSAVRKQLCIKYNKQTGELNLQSRRNMFLNENTLSYISIDLNNIKKAQPYILNSSNVIDISMQIYGSEKGYYFNANSGFLNIHRLDTINNIISGEFEIELTERESTMQKKKIYNGRFDLQMDYCTSN